MKHHFGMETLPSEATNVSDAERRIKQYVSSDPMMTLVTVKDALLEVMKRDGQATWASVAKQLASMRQSAGEFRRIRLDASIELLRKLADGTSPSEEPINPT